MDPSIDDDLEPLITTLPNNSIRSETVHPNPSQPNHTGQPADTNQLSQHQHQQPTVDLLLDVLPDHDVIRYTPPVIPQPPIYPRSIHPHKPSTSNAKDRKRKMTKVLSQSPGDVVTVSEVVRPTGRKRHRPTTQQKKKSTTLLPLHELRTPSGHTATSAAIPIHSGQKFSILPTSTNALENSTAAGMFPSPLAPNSRSLNVNPADVNTKADGNAVTVVPYVAPAPSAADILDLDLGEIFETDSGNGCESGSRAGGNFSNHSTKVRSSPANMQNNKTDCNQSGFRFPIEMNDFISPSEVKAAMTARQKKSSGSRAQQNKADSDVNIDSLYPSVPLDQLTTHSDLEAQNFVSSTFNRVLGISTDQVDIHDRRMDESELDLDFQASDLYNDSFHFENSIDSNDEPYNDSSRRNHEGPGEGGPKNQQIEQSNRFDDSDADVEIQTSGVETADGRVNIASQIASVQRQVQMLEKEKKRDDNITDSNDVEDDICATITGPLKTNSSRTGKGRQGEKVAVEDINIALQEASLMVEDTGDGKILELPRLMTQLPMNQELTSQDNTSSDVHEQVTGVGDRPRKEAKVYSCSQRAAMDTGAKEDVLIPDGDQMLNDLMDFVQNTDSTGNENKLTREGGNGVPVEAIADIPQVIGVARLRSGETTGDITRFEEVASLPTDMLESIGKDSSFSDPTDSALRNIDPTGQISLRDLYPPEEPQSEIPATLKSNMAPEDSEILTIAAPLLPTANVEDMAAGEKAIEELSNRYHNNDKRTTINISRGAHQSGNAQRRIGNMFQARTQTSQPMSSQPTENQALQTASKKPLRLQCGAFLSSRTAPQAGKTGDIPAVDKDVATKKRHELVARRSLKRAARQAIRNNNGINTTVGNGIGLGDSTSFADRSHSGKMVVPMPSVTENSITTGRGNEDMPATATAANAVVTEQELNFDLSRQASGVGAIAGLSHSSRSELGIAGGRVDKGGTRRGGGARNPAHAHLSIEERRQLRAQRNRESAEKSRVRRKLATAELERSVASLRSESIWRGMRCQRTNMLLRDVLRALESPSASAAADRDGEGEGSLTRSLHQCVTLLESVKKECPRTFRQISKDPSVEMKFR